MTELYDLIKHSNKIEGVEGEEAIYQSLDAYNYLKTKMRDREKLTHDILKGVHKRVMEERQPEIAGKYKEKENFVVTGMDRKFFTPPEKVEEKLDKLFEVVPETSLETLKWHINAINIHSFPDGNGRVFRLIYFWQAREQVGFEPLVFRAEDRIGYYNLVDTTEGLFVDPEVRYESRMDEIVELMEKFD